VKEQQSAKINQKQNKLKTVERKKQTRDS